MNFSAQDLIDDIYQWLNIDISHHFHFNSSSTPPIRSGDVITVESVMEPWNKHVGMYQKGFMFYKNRCPVFYIWIDNIFDINCIILAFEYAYSHNNYETPVRYYIRAGGIEMCTGRYHMYKKSHVDICDVDELYSYAKKSMSIQGVTHKFEPFPKLSFLQRILDDINKNKEIVIEI